jgi:hypothetical protein
MGLSRFEKAFDQVNERQTIGRNERRGFVDR